MGIIDDRDAIYHLGHTRILSALCKSGTDCCSAGIIAGSRMVRCVSATQIASASKALFLIAASFQRLNVIECLAASRNIKTLLFYIYKIK